MPRINKSRYAILGILSYAPRSGYGIKKMTDVSTNHFWSESYAHIYATLEKLEHEGLVTMTKRQQEGKPDKKVYAITDAGRRALDAWLDEPAQSAPVRNELLLKIFFGNRLSHQAVRKHLDRYRRQQRERIASYEGLEAWLETEHAGSPNLPYWLMTLSYGRHDAVAMMRWCDESLASLERREAEPT